MTEFRTNNLSTGIPQFLANSSFLPFSDPSLCYQEDSLSYQFEAVKYLLKKLHFSYRLSLCDAVEFGVWIPIFQRNISPASSGCLLQ